MVTLTFPSLSPCSNLRDRHTNTSSGAKISSFTPPSTLKMVFKTPKLGKVSASRSSLISCTAAGKEAYMSSTTDHDETQKLLEGLGLKEEEMPKHVAVIMDGNRRWALERGFPAMAGHAAGRMALEALITLCVKYGIKVLTVFAFSTENWSRTKEEVDHLMDLLTDAISSGVEKSMKRNIRVSIIGERSRLPESLQGAIATIEDRTKNNTEMEHNIAINYSGKYDIIQACKSIAAKVKDGVIPGTDAINENLFEQELLTKFGEYPCPDLLIRTSGEIRLSNFMMWQLAYTELYFTDVLFPDFREDDFLQALFAYQKNCRRYVG